MRANSSGSNGMRWRAGTSMRTALAVSSNQASPTGTRNQFGRWRAAPPGDDEIHRAILAAVDDDALQAAGRPILQIEDVDRLERPAPPPIEVGCLHVDESPTGCAFGRRRGAGRFSLRAVIPEAHR
jgi:hypothetical protein